MTTQYNTKWQVAAEMLIEKPRHIRPDMGFMMCQGFFLYISRFCFIVGSDMDRIASKHQYLSICPTSMKSLFLISLRQARLSTVVFSLAAISLKVSPGITVYVRVPIAVSAVSAGAVSLDDP